MNDDDNKGYQTSTDYVPTGVTVGSGPAGFAREVHSASDLNDDDTITVDGMEIKAKMAREMGLLDRVFDEGLNAGSAAQNTDTPTPQLEVVRKSETGHASYDEAMDSLTTMVDDGSMDASEAQAYDLGLAEIAMSGLSVEHVTETLEGLANGSISELDVPEDVRAMASQVEDSVHKAATTAARKELGAPAFDALSKLASSHAGVDQVITQYAIDRAQGKHGGVSWADLYTDLNEQLGL